MNVLFAFDYGAPKSGNFIPSLLDLAGKIRENGGQPVFLSRKIEPERCHWVDWIRSLGYPLLTLDPDKSILEQFQTLVQEYRLDIIHIHFEWNGGLLSKNARALRPARIIIHDHMGFNNQHKLRQRLRNLYYSLQYRLHGVYLVAANRQKARSFALCRHWFVPNGLSMLRYTDDPRRNEGRTPGDNVWNAPAVNHELRCLFLGWHPRFKGLDVAMKAVYILRQRGVNIVLCILGFEHGMSTAKQAFLENATGLSIHTDYFRYLKSEEDMFSVHRAMDVYLSASRVEAFSYGLLEAISQNVPVVVSDIPGTKWSAAYSKSFFYPVEDAEQCANALEKAIAVRGDPSNAAELVARYSVDKWTQKMLEIFNKGCLCKKQKKKRRWIKRLAVVLIVFLLLSSLELLWSNYHVSVSSYSVSSEKINAPIRVVFLSDLHGRSFGTENSRLLKKIAAQEPDLIALVGDIFNNNADPAEIDAMCALIHACRSIAPVYFGLGNHESAYINRISTDLLTRITEAGAVILDNNYYDLDIKGSPFRLGGYMGYYYQAHMMTADPQQARWEREFTKDFENTDRFKLLLNHIPTSWLDWNYIDTHPVDLVLSGHYHGGVVRVPLLEKGLFAPYIGWWPPFTKGLFTGAKASCILTTGMAGSYGLPRFFNPPEICVVDVIPQK